LNLHFFAITLKTKALILTFQAASLLFLAFFGPKIFHSWLQTDHSIQD
jgi:hypothetical protein